MQKRLMVAAALLGAWLAPARAADFRKFNFNIGGGPSAPLNPTANYVGVSGHFTTGAGYNINDRNSISGEFLWNGLPPNRSLRPAIVDIVNPINAPFGTINLYTLTANYRYHVDHVGGPFGLYAIAGGGWYYRFASIDKDFFVPPGTVCTPIYTWWGYTCDFSGFVVTETLASKGNSAGGVNGGVGFTIRLTDSGWKFYVESRYHYAWHHPVATTFIPVTFGFRFR